MPNTPPCPNELNLTNLHEYDATRVHKTYFHGSRVHVDLALGFGLVYDLD